MTRLKFEKSEIRRKPNLFHECRGVSLKDFNEDLMGLVMDSTNNDIKDTILRIKTDKTYDKYMKNLNEPDVNILRDVLVYLRKKENRREYLDISDDFLKTGLIHEIITMVSRMLIYECDGCQIIINNSNGMKSHPSIGCGISACKDCYDNLKPNQKFICRSCVDVCEHMNKIPIPFLKFEGKI